MGEQTTAVAEDAPETVALLRAELAAERERSARLAGRLDIIRAVVGAMVDG